MASEANQEKRGGRKLCRQMRIKAFLDFEQQKNVSLKFLVLL